MVSPMFCLVVALCILGAQSSTAPYQYNDDALYSFAYAVQDAYTGQDFGHSEDRVRDLVTGQYHVLLPDGRVQLVKYKADGYGYVADVSYTDGAVKPAYGQGGSYVKAHANPAAAGGYGVKGAAYPPPPGPYQPVSYDLSGYSAYSPAAYGSYLPASAAGGGYVAIPYALAAHIGLKLPCDH